MNKRKKLSIDHREWDKTFQLMSWWKKDDVQKATVMVVGAGALGNEVLKNLALLNVGHIVIVDFDTVEYANLCRSVLFRGSDCDTSRLKADAAAERIQELNPNIQVITIEGDITIDVGLGVFRRMDVVIGCLDNRLARLFINRHCHRVGKTWVDGAIENLAGQLEVYKPKTTCYECGLTDREWASIRFKLGCPDIAKRNAAQGRIPTTPISASIIAAMQVQEALKVIHHNDKQSLVGKRFYYEGMNNIVLQFDSAPLKEECMSHYDYDPVIEAEEMTADMSVKEALEALSKRLNCDNPIIDLDYELVLEITTKNTEKTTKVLIPKPHLSDKTIKQYQVEQGEDIVIIRDTNTIDNSFEHLDVSLKKIGIPPLQILNVYANDETYFVELSGDASFIAFEPASD